MSGSFDRPDRPTGRPMPAQRPHEYEYDDVVTGRSAGSTSQGRYPGDYAFPEPELTGEPHTGYGSSFDPIDEAEVVAPARSKRGKNGVAPIVPQGSVTGRSLTLVITIMCFLACLTAGAVYMIRQSAEAWLKDIASEVTVQIEPKDNADNEKLVKDVVVFLERQPGIAKVRALSIEESAGLLEPWLGKVEELKSLPVPRLVAIEVDRSAPPNLDGLRADIEKRFSGTSLDDHRQWQQQIRTITRSFALGGVAILALVAAATMAIIVSATKSSMASNKEIVEVLHFVGATDRFIAREFEKHFLSLGVRAGLVGAGLATAVFVIMPTLVELLGGGTVTLAELNRLIGSGSLDLAGYVLMGIVVVVVAALCMLTSRYGVFRILNSRQ